MTKKYVFGMFVLCFCVWAVVVDNMILPAEDSLRQDVGQYTRHRVKKWTTSGKYNLIQDELLIYAIVKNREQLYYMECKPHFETTLKKLPRGTPVQMRYCRGFPKLWKKQVYTVRSNGLPVVRYSSVQLVQKQREIWKFTGIMGGVYLFLLVLGRINAPRRK